MCSVTGIVAPHPLNKFDNRCSRFYLLRPIRKIITDMLRKIHISFNCPFKDIPESRP